MKQFIYIYIGFFAGRKMKIRKNKRYKCFEISLEKIGMFEEVIFVYYK